MLRRLRIKTISFKSIDYVTQILIELYTFRFSGVGFREKAFPYRVHDHDLSLLTGERADRVGDLDDVFWRRRIEENVALVHHQLVVPLADDLKT